MKVFVTGHRGYIGAHLVELLTDAGHAVTGCDLGLFDGCACGEVTQPVVELVKDVRAVALEDLRGHDCVMHLAAISNDPMGDLDPGLTLSVNRDASVRLARLAKEAGVPRFVFASSCSIYGAGEDGDLTEAAALNPLTAYATSKVEAEARIQELADGDFCPVLMRNATAFGHSPMLRVDLVVNNLLASALAYGKILINSDGLPWRPLIHCRDIARAMVAFMDADAGKVGGKAVNVGDRGCNHQVKDIAAQVQRLLPHVPVEYTGKVGKDPRDYRVDTSLMRELLPGFRLEHDLASGLADLHRHMTARGFGVADLEGDRFVRLRWLQARMGMLERAAT